MLRSPTDAAVDDTIDLCDPHRLPLPPGHVVSWAALLAGSSLEGLDWPGWPSRDCPPPLAQGVAR